MATYIPNVTDTFPEIQPFRPDYGFLQSALQYKQSKFDAAFNQLNSVYGSILNAPLTRGINQQRRDEFIKAADAEVKKITSLDLSLPQNVQMASNVFKPFYEDKNIVKDMTWTKNWSNEVQRANSLKNSPDEKVYEQYWDGGVQLLNYERERFANADDQEALQMGSSSYVPAYNVVKEAVNLAKEQGFNVKYDTIKNGYIVTTKNGKALEAPLSVYFSEVFANNPRATAYMNAQAKLKRETEIRQMAPQYNNDLKLAETAYIQNNLQTVLDLKEAQNRELEDDFIKVSASRAAFEDIMKRRNLLPSEQRRYEETIVSYNTLNSALDRNAAAIARMSDISTENMSTARNIVDNMVGSTLMGASLQKAVKAAAYRDTQTSYKADPYSLARYKDQLTEAREIRKEKREAEQKAVEMGLFDTLLQKQTNKNFKIEDIYKDQSASVTASRSKLSQDVSVLVSTLRAGSDSVASALDGLIKKNGLTESDLTGKTVASATKYKNLFEDINETILTKDKQLYTSLNPIIKEAMADVEKYNYQSKMFNENNLLIARKLKQTTYKENPELVDLLIDPNTGEMIGNVEVFAKKAKKKGVSVEGESSILNRLGDDAGDLLNLGKGFLSNVFGLETTPEQAKTAQKKQGLEDAEDVYEELLENISKTYDRSRDELKSLGIAVTGGAGGRGVAKTGVAIVDPYRFQSPTLAAARSLLLEIDDFNNIDAGGTDVNGKAILENLRIDLNTYYKNPTADRPIASIEYIPFKDGSTTKHEAIIKLNADYLNRLKTQGLIDKDKDTNEIEELAINGIRVEIDPSKTRNEFKKGLSLDYRDVILQNTGVYTIENPGGQITLNLQPDGSIAATGHLNQFKNGDIVKKPYSQPRLENVGGPNFYNQYYDMLLQQALVNQVAIEKSN
jgi:hypothetical protein